MNGPIMGTRLQLLLNNFEQRDLGRVIEVAIDKATGQKLCLLCA